jgi:hypothetical protein
MLKFNWTALSKLGQPQLPYLEQSSFRHGLDMTGDKRVILEAAWCSILWHIWWKQELWSQQRQPLLGNGSVSVTWWLQQTCTQQEKSYWKWCFLCLLEPQSGSASWVTARLFIASFSIYIYNFLCATGFCSSLNTWRCYENFHSSWEWCFSQLYALYRM